jgi:hypothetical protein
VFLITKYLYLLGQRRYKKLVGNFPFKPKNNKIRNKWKAHLQTIEHTRIALQAYNYQPSGKRDIDRPRKRWRDTTILEAGTRDSPNP